MDFLLLISLHYVSCLFPRRHNQPKRRCPPIGARAPARGSDPPPLLFREAEWERAGVRATRSSGFAPRPLTFCTPSPRLTDARGWSLHRNVSRREVGSTRGAGRREIGRINCPTSE